MRRICTICIIVHTFLLSFIGAKSSMRCRIQERQIQWKKKCTFHNTFIQYRTATFQTHCYLQSHGRSNNNNNNNIQKNVKNRKTSVEKAKKNGYIYIVRRNLEIYLRLGDNVNVIRRIGARMNSKVTWVIEKCAGNGFFCSSRWWWLFVAGVLCMCVDCCSWDAFKQYENHWCYCTARGV